MSDQVFNLPDLGEGLTEAEVVRWLVADGDVVEVDQPVVEVETAKSLVEVPSPFAGVVSVRHAPEGSTVDVGKPLRQAKADALALARYLEFYGGAADKLHGETIPYQQGYTVLTLREPHGVTGHIVPWNYPMQIIGRSVGAALAMGNATVLKPAEEACLTALAFARIAEQAGFPAGAINVVTGLGEEAGAAGEGAGDATPGEPLLVGAVPAQLPPPGLWRELFELRLGLRAPCPGGGAVT